jgi:RNA-directed DNA polymerase
MALEPIFEVEFHDNSYGFRPNRSTHHAVAQCRQTALQGYTWVIEGDVRACLDNASGCPFKNASYRTFRR